MMELQFQGFEVGGGGSEFAVGRLKNFNGSKQHISFQHGKYESLRVAKIAYPQKRRPTTHTCCCSEVQRDARPRRRRMRRKAEREAETHGHGDGGRDARRSARRKRMEELEAETHGG
ncbi:hypothetical protein SESBI_19800 [Sesbania bispinosa]|nr:hypothetical protein SESBI_19800 [Sesbania bispinosa]